MNKELNYDTTQRFNNKINARSTYNRKLSLMRFDTQQIIYNTGSHIIRVQFCRNATVHKVSVNKFQHIQTQAKAHTAPQRIGVCNMQ